MEICGKYSAKNKAVRGKITSRGFFSFHGNIKKLFIPVLIIMLPFFVFGGDSYNYDLNDFNKIEVTGNMTVVLEKRSEPGLYIELDNSSIDDLRWYISVKTLVIKKKSSFPDFNDIKIVIYYSDNPESVMAKNRALIKNIRKIKSERILIEAVSGGIIDLIIETGNIEARSVRTSRITLKGTAGKLLVQADSGSEVNSFDMAAEKVQAFAHSGGIVKVNASQSIDGSSGLGSHIYFKGSPSRKIFTSGTGGKVTEIK